MKQKQNVISRKLIFLLANEPIYIIRLILYGTKFLTKFRKLCEF